MKKPQIIPKVGDKLVQPFGTYLGLPDGGNIKPGEALTITKVSPQYRFVTVQTEDGRSRFTHFDSGYKEQYPAPDPFSDEALGPVTEQREQYDPVYLAALQELQKIEGLAKINTVAHFVAAMFGKTFAEVIIDACDEFAPAGVVFPGAVA